MWLGSRGGKVFEGCCAHERKTRVGGRFYAPRRHTAGCPERRTRCTPPCRPGSAAWSGTFTIDELITFTR